MKTFFLSLLTLLLMTLPTLATEEAPALGISGGNYPLVNESTKILISHASYPDLSQFKVEVTYRPNSSTSTTETLTTVNDDGYVEWKPTTAGIATIKAVAPDLKNKDKKITIEKSVSVRFGTFPPAGILIFGFAAIILFGGLILLIFVNTKSSTTA